MVAVKLAKPVTTKYSGRIQKQVKISFVNPQSNEKNDNPQNEKWKFTTFLFGLRIPIVSDRGLPKSRKRPWNLEFFLIIRSNDYRA